jgi:hypothetical protein
MCPNIALTVCLSVGHSASNISFVPLNCVKILFLRKETNPVAALKCFKIKTKGPGP